MKKLYSLFTLLLLFVGVGQVQASHISGGEILYDCTGNNPNEYIITLNLFRDCDGISLSSSQNVTITSPCGGTQNVSMTLQNPGGTEISQLCQPQLPNSQCSGGTLPGMELYTFTATVILNPQCDFYTFSWSTCCRNVTVNVPTSTSNDTYLEATLNTADFPCNDSPIFNAQPIPYVCVNQIINYSFGVSDFEGDSLVYVLIPGMEAGGTLLNYGGVFSGTNPIDGITLDPQTGFITFTATQTGNYIVVVQIEQYDRITGELIGTVLRDIQIVVVNCTNTPPDPTTGQIGSFTGTALNPTPYAIEMCPTDTFCMTIQIDDPDVGDSLTLFSNIQTVLPGATINTYHAPGGNPIYADICWSAPNGMTGLFPFILVAQDDACPIASQQTYVYTVNIPTSTSAGPDHTICGDDGAQLAALGGSNFNWTSISGDPINGANFTCNPCANPIATPTQTTTYVVTSNLSSTCQNTDTVTVTVVPDFTWNVTNDNPNPCLQEPIGLDLTITPGGAGFTYDWDLVGTPTAQATIDIDSDSIEDPTLSNPSIGGTYSWQITIVSPDGCIKIDTIDVDIIQAFPPSVTGFADSAICAGDSLQLDASLGNVNPNVVYSWTPDSTLSDGSIQNPWASPTVPGMYIVTATDTNSGCSDSDTIWVDIYPDPTVLFSASPSVGVAPLDVSFINQSDANTNIFDWTFVGGNPDSSNLTDPNVTYDTPGTYPVSLTAVNIYGCVGSFYGTVIVEEPIPPYMLEIPNVFSPNGDFINDEFELLYEGVKEFHGEIYNRWGKKVYEWTDVSAHWSGDDYSAGTYFYIIKTTSEAGDAYEYNGHVTLVR